jgi:putative tryptophan/tyrosine transport system substrate-binding protein
MQRREFISLLCGVAAYPFASRAQQADRMRRIGVLISIADDSEGRSRLAAFQQGLRELHWTEGRDLQIDVRWSAADVERSHSYAAELVSLNPDVLIAHAPLALASLQ